MQEVFLQVRKVGSLMKKDAFDFANLGESLASQFRNLDQGNPSSWPIVPKALVCVLIAAVVCGAVWHFMVTPQIEELESKQQEEIKLKEDFSKKYAKVVNLEPLRQQRRQVEQYVAQLEKQLPSKAEMDALLSDINQAGVGRNLQFDLFKPAQEEVRNYYAVLPVAIKVSGQFPDIAGFAADIAHLSRIVTLGEIVIDPLQVSSGKSAATTLLQMQAVANTYRYLDKAEVDGMNKKAGEAK